MVPPVPDTETRARDLLRRAPVLDGHNDLPYAMRSLNNYDLEAYDIAHRHTETHTDIPRLRDGGVGAQFWSVFVPSNLRPHEAVTQTLEQVDFVHAMCARHAETFALASTADDVVRAVADGRIASLMGAEGGQSIGCSLGALRMLHRLGVRYMTLTHNDNNPWADSATDQPRHSGLSAFGHEVVREMNRTGMLVDLSHVSPATMSSALDTTVAPVIFSHSSARAINDHVRNVPDDVLARLRGNGGVCMVTFVPDFVSPEVNAWSVEVKRDMAAQGLDPRDFMQYLDFAREYSSTSPRPPATVAQVADHVEHVREVAGIEHVGLGGDYDGCDGLPVGLEDVSGYPNLIAELMGRGWSDDECAQLTQGNALRALRDAELTSARLRRERGPSRATLAELDGAATA